MTQKGYRFRIYPNKKQEELISSFFGCYRYVYNICLTYRKDLYVSEKRNVSRYECMRKITLMRSDPETPWLKDCDSMALQESVKDLDRAYENFFGKRSGYPKYHKKHSSVQSYRTRNQNNSIRFEGNRLHLPKLGLVRIKKSREVCGKILNATVSRSASGKYFVSLCAQTEASPMPNSGAKVGIDVGIRSFYTDSNGNTIKSPAPLCAYEKKLIREQRKLSRMINADICRYTKNRRPVYKRPISECRNIQKQRQKLARIHEKIADIRNDFLHKESTKLVSENQVIGIEDLNVKGMLHNRFLSGPIADMSWSSFVCMLEYKSAEYGTTIVKVPHFYASSQICSCCGYKNPDVRDLTVRKWICPECGTNHDRDHNAAVNILNQALSVM